MGKGLIQLCFRVNGNRLNDWNIECNTGEKIHTLFSNSYKDLNRIRYKRNDKGKIILQSKKSFHRYRMASECISCRGHK